jgi:hypothetical protein
VTAPRILALRGTPAEAEPGTPVALDALVAAPEGTVTAPLDWSLCHAARPLATNAAVSAACLALDSVDYLVYAQPAVTATIPADACKRFGPEPPPHAPGEPELRPRDPDATGGYYQPYRADLAEALTIGLERIRCQLVGASMEAAQAFAERYHANQHPALVRLTASADPVAVDGDLTLTAELDAAAVESYPLFDPSTQALTDVTENLRISWFATAGQFEHEGTAVADGLAVNGWHAPSAPTTVHIWAVARDDRGGIGWLEGTVEVR